MKRILPRMQRTIFFPRNPSSALIPHHDVKLNVNAVTLHITSLHWFAELSAHQPGIWHLLTSDDILETAETLNRCQSQIWYWIQKYKEIRRHSKSKESERDPKRNGTRLETLLASLGVSWRLESRLRSDDPFHILVAGPSTQARLESTQKLKHKTQNCSKTQK